MWLEGIIRSSSFQRPHEVIEMEGPGPQPTTWTVVLGSPSRMKSRGLAVGKLVPGVKVKVYVYPAIEVENEARALRISIDGNVTELW